MNTVIRNARIVNEDRVIEGDVLITGDRIARVGSVGDVPAGTITIEAAGSYLLPGLIDDQVHFREPGLTHKADIFSESRAAVAGGITSFMEMPNTVPGATTVELLEQKYAIASKSSAANYSFFMGTTNDNLEEVLRIDPEQVCGVKIFMGSSTGNMLVEKEDALEGLFSRCEKLIATHCEDDNMIRMNMDTARETYGDNIPVEMHPLIRSRQACLASSQKAIALARKHGTRLHILHISTAEETLLFDNTVPLAQKRITAEACAHHLWFTDADYARKGNFIKWNPAVKSDSDRQAIRQAVADGRIDVLATDHAPHTIEEKEQPYAKAPSGGPLVQHALLGFWDLVHQGVFSPELVVRKACHNVADLFGVRNRGYIREGYFADLVLLDPDKGTAVSRNNVLYKCGWSPFEGHTFRAAVTHTFVNGNLVWNNGALTVVQPGERMLFDR
jgi:dihydroorotase